MYTYYLQRDAYNGKLFVPKISLVFQIIPTTDVFIFQSSTNIQRVDISSCITLFKIESCSLFTNKRYRQKISETHSNIDNIVEIRTSHATSNKVTSSNWHYSGCSVLERTENKVNDYITS